ncbi:MAG: hypothetical protein ABIR58_09350 [Gemmatimonadaceae bacterium]
MATDPLGEVNAAGLRTAAEIDPLIAKMDVVVTARLDGLVLALKNGVPAVAIDWAGGGGKIIRQARVLGWPVVLTFDTKTNKTLAQAFDYCKLRLIRLPGGCKVSQTVPAETVSPRDRPADQPVVDGDSSASILWEIPES